MQELLSQVDECGQHLSLTSRTERITEARNETGEVVLKYVKVFPR